MIYYFHGGACLFGSTADLDPRHTALLSTIAPVTAVPYRLAIQESLQKSIARLQNDLQKQIISDPNPIVIGHSFGGYLAVLMTFLIPKIKTCVSFSGYGDLLAEFYTTPSIHYKDIKLPDSFNSTNINSESSVRDRVRLYYHLRATGQWPHYVSRGRINDLRELSPCRIPPPNSKQFLLIHGREDVDVPWGESHKLYNHVRLASPASHLFIIDRAGHNCFREIERESIRQVWGSVVASLQEKGSVPPPLCGAIEL